VVLPGQYRGQDGQQRVYGEVQVSLYASDVADWQALTITNTSRTIDNSTVTIVVGTAVYYLSFSSAPNNRATGPCRRCFSCNS
jgi:hypothetical protein